MILDIARFELRYQIRNPVFWVVGVMLFVLTFGSITVEGVNIGAAGGAIHANAPFAIVITHLVLSILFMFVATAFVANVVVRDDETGFGAIVRTTRVTKAAYLFGRFAGALIAGALLFLLVPLALWLGSLMPWLDQETLGPAHLSYYAFAYFVIALPTIFFTSAIFFALATVTRSMMATYLGVVAFLILYGITVFMLKDQPHARELLGYIEPFGAGAFSALTRYWTAAERNTLLPPLDGLLLANRLIWIGVGVVALGLAYWRFSFAERSRSRRALRREAHRAAIEATPPTRFLGRLPEAHPGRAGWGQLVARTMLEARMIVRSPAFIVLLLLGLLNLVPALFAQSQMYGTKTYPLTRTMINELNSGFSAIPFVIALYYAGEAVWRDRARKVNELIDASPIPDWAFVLPKTLAVALVLFATLAVGAVAGMVGQLVQGHADLQLGEYFWWYLLPNGVDAVLLAVVAVFLQAIAPNKYVGWGLMLLYLISTMVLSQIGAEDQLYQYASGPHEALSDMNAHGRMMHAAWWFRLYWGAFAAVMLVVAHLLWRRGTEPRLLPRLKRLPRRLVSGAGLIGGGALALFVATGGFIFYNTHVLNTYRTSADNERYSADYEKTLLRYIDVPQPSVSGVTMHVALYPHDARAVTSGRYILRNDTGRPLDRVDIRRPDRDLKMAVAVQGAHVARDYARFGYRIYRFDEPLQPGDTRIVTFRTDRWQRGFANAGYDTKIVANGTFLNNFDIAPAIGMSRSDLLQDPTTRRKYGLPDELRPPKLEDVAAQAHNYTRVDWTTTDITVSTEADQVPIAPGHEVSSRVVGDRRVARFVSEAPILGFFSIQSARYAVKRQLHDGVALAVYYDPADPWNVDRMLKAMGVALDYYQAHFGPYQFDQARIIEFPGYQTFAQSFANTIPYSENIGFAADARDPDSIDYVTYVTAHELAHQYWAHQVIGADMQGATMLSETLAQYSALMVMKHLYGPDKIRRFLRYELDDYLRNRGRERLEELPLDRVENQPYIHYRKGSLAMYLLQDRLGEDKVNTALRTLLARYKFKAAPYPSSLDLVAALRAEASTPAQQQLITDLFQRITIYDLKAVEAKTSYRPDGKWATTMTVEAHKFYVDGKGNEREVAFDEPIDLGAFTAEPGEGVFNRADVLTMPRRSLRRGRQRVLLVTERKPRFVGIDPYNMIIDRNSADNIVPIG